MKRYSIILCVLTLTTLVLSACGGKGPLPPADTTLPTVIAVNPANGAQNVPINSSVIITFSEAMDASSINGQTIVLSTGNSNVQGTVTYSGVTAIFKPTSNLNPQTIYTVAVDAGVKDAAGNAMGSPFGYIFITGAQQDTTPPRVVDVQPSNHKTGVSVNTGIVVMFSEPMDPTTITNANIQISSLGRVIPSTVTYFDLGSAAIIKTTLDLPQSTDFVILVTTRVKDLAGNAMDAFVSSFRTGTGPDTSPPSVVAGSIIPASGSATVSVNTPISVTFSKPMNVSTINRSTFIVSDGTSTVPGNLQYYGTTVVFTPTTPLLSSTVYTVTINKLVVDLSANTMTSDYSWNFTTEPQVPDSSPPQILSTYPTLNQTNVPVYRNIVVLFNETMLVSSITPTTFSLADPQGTLVPGNITSNGAMIVFTPTQPLLYNTIYTATMTTAATDIAGNPLTSNYSWSFTTELIAAFTITPSAGANGSINPNTVQTVNYGATPSFTITPAIGYHVFDVLVDGSSVGQVSSYSFTGVTADHTISASFAINTYTITTTLATNGTISPVNPTVSYGGSQTLSITPNTGYHIVDVQADSVSVGAVTTYTFTNVTANHTISATFAIDTYALTVNASGTGSGTVGGAGTYNYGTTVNPTAVVNTGSTFTGWSGDCSGTTSPASVLMNAAKTCTATFTLNMYALTVNASGTGSGTVGGAGTYSYGLTAQPTAVATNGSTFTGWSGDCSGTASPTSVVMNAAKTCTANFAIDTFSINFVAGSNGTLTGTTSQTVSYGGSAAAVTAVPSTGYHFVNWTGTGGFVTTMTNPLTVTNVTAAQTITANFAINTFSINFVSGGNGTLTGTTSQTVNYGASATAVTAVPSTGYHFVNWTGTGGFVTTTTNPLTVTNVTAAQTITANFAIDTFTITASAGVNGSISPAGSVVVNYSAGQTFTITPDSSFTILDVLVDSLSQGPVASYTFTNVTADHTISATFQ